MGLLKACLLYTSAVGGDGNILRTAHELEDIGGNLLVIYCHGTPPHIIVCLPVWT